MESKQAFALQKQIDRANGIKQEPSVLQLKAALIKARDALATCSTGMCDQIFDAQAVHEALTAINEVLK